MTDQQELLELAIEIVNSFVSFIFKSVSFGKPVRPLNAGEKPTIGGLAPNPLKKEYGAKFISPFLLIEATKAIGLGTIPEIIKW